MIKVTCSSCGKSFNVKDDRRGKALVCRCGARIEVPADAPAITEGAVEEPVAAEAPTAKAAAEKATSAERAATDKVTSADKDEPTPSAEPRAGKLRPGGAARPSPDAETPAEPPTRAPRGASALGAPSAGGSKQGAIAVLLPPSRGGALTMLWLGLVLLLGSFAIKQLLVSWALGGAGDALEMARLAAKQDAEMFDAREDIEELELEKRMLRPDEDADADARKKAREEAEEIDKKIEKLQKDVAKELREIEEDYAEDMLAARGDEKHATAFALRKAKWFLSLKLLLDLAKIAGSILVVLAGLQVVADPEQDGGTKAYATVAAGVALVAMLLGGIITLLG